MISYRPEDQLLLAVTAPERDPARIEELTAEVRDWPAVIRAAFLNDVLPQLAVVLKSEGCLANLPRPISHTLSTLAKRSVLLDRNQSEALSEICRAFGEHDIPFTLLKGLGLAERLYRTPYERVSADVDVLTTADALDRTDAVLKSLGYESQDPETYRQSHFHIPYRRGESWSSINVELHWEVTKPGAAVRFDLSRWWRDHRVAELRSGRVCVPSPADELPYLCHHAFVKGSVTLRNLSDVCRLGRSSGVWEEAEERARGNGTARFVRTARLLSEELWGESGARPAFAAPPVGPRQWLARNILAPSTVLRVGRSTWWPFARICYWSLLGREASSVGDLLSRVLGTPHNGPAGGIPRAALKLGSLGLALLLCCLPLHLFPARFRSE